MTDAASTIPYGDRILDAAIDLATERGWPTGIIRDEVAARAGVATGTVNWCFGTIDKLRDQVMTTAIERQLTGIIAQGLAAGSIIARGAPDALKRAALDSLT